MPPGPVVVESRRRAAEPGCRGAGRALSSGPRTVARPRAVGRNLASVHVPYRSRIGGLASCTGRRYTIAMCKSTASLSVQFWGTSPALGQGPLIESFTLLYAEHLSPKARVWDLEARLVQISASS